VLCSSHSWDLASAAPSGMEGVAAVGAGTHKMKGVQNSDHLYSCTHMHSYTAGVCVLLRAVSAVIPLLASVIRTCHHVRTNPM
jgi:hypothetical protein